MKSFWLAFLPMFVAVDPVGMIPLFLGMTAGLERGRRRKVIAQSVATALLVALAFLFVGKAILRVLGVTIADFLIAGGVMLFTLALADLVSTQKLPQPVAPDDTIGAVPLGVPLIVGPAVLATSLVLVDQYGILLTVVSIATNVLLAGVVMLSSNFLSRLLGNAGTRVVSKLASLILATLAVMFIRSGIASVIKYWGV